MRSTEVSAIITSCTCPAAITVRTPGWWLAAERCSISDPNDDDGAGAHVGGAARAVQASAPTQTAATPTAPRSEEHTSELQSRFDLVCRLLLDKKHRQTKTQVTPFSE